MNITLLECIKNARQAGKAVGHFNISNIEGLKAVFGAALKLNVPVIVGVSEGERDFIGVKQAVALVQSLREQYSFPIFINADHTYSYERVKEAIDAGFDAVIIDGAKLPLAENIAMVKKCFEYAKEVEQKTGKKVIVEAELGYIGTSSKVQATLPDGVSIDPATHTKVEEAVSFVQATGIDMFAPSVGNVHGIIMSGQPHLDIQRIREIAQAVSTPLVLHGASGITLDDLDKAIEAGIAIVHYSTELRVAYRDAFKISLASHPEEVAPYRIALPSVTAMQAVVEEKLKIMNRL